MEQFMKLVEGFVDMVADKVLVKLWETQRMKDFLAGKNPDSSIDAENVNGLNHYIKNIVERELENQDRRVDADDVDGLEKYVEDVIEKTLEQATVTIST